MTDLTVTRVLVFQNTEEKHEQDEAAAQGTYISTFQLHAPESPQVRLKDPKNLSNNGFNNCGFVDDESRVPSSSDLKTDRAVVARKENGAGKVGVCSTLQASLSLPPFSEILP